MTEETDSSYFERRAREEQEAADRCNDERARSTHRAMAQRYRDAALNPQANEATRLPDTPGPLLSPEFRILD